jgi:hypothetical protein
MSLGQYIIEYFKQSPPFIQLVWGLSVVFFIIASVLVMYLKYLRNHLREKERITAKYQDKYETHLITYLYSGNDEDNFSPEQHQIINELKKSVADPFKRTIIVATLLKLRNEISGEIAESIDKLYIELGLMRYSLSKLRDKRWDIIAIGIRELTQFHVKGVHKVVMNNINHPKREVRKEMQLYLIKLFSFKGLAFLNVLETPLSEWDQIQLLEVLQVTNNEQITDITPWLKSPNDSVVIFALKLAKIYNQFEAKGQLIELLDHQSENIRVNVIYALSHLNIVEAKNVLKNNFLQRSPEEQIAFLKMMENVYENSDKPFLLQHIQHDNFEIKLLIMEILKNINFEEYVLYESELKKTLTA